MPTSLFTLVQRASALLDEDYNFSKNLRVKTVNDVGVEVLLDAQWHLMTSDDL